MVEEITNINLRNVCQVSDRTMNQVHPMSYCKYYTVRLDTIIVSKQGSFTLTKSIVVLKVKLLSPKMQASTVLSTLLYSKSAYLVKYQHTKHEIPDITCNHSDQMVTISALLALN